MFELVLAMCGILLMFIVMCIIEKIPGVDKMLEKGVEVMTIENTPKRLSSFIDKKRVCENAQTQAQTD